MTGPGNRVDGPNVWTYGYTAMPTETPMKSSVVNQVLFALISVAILSVGFVRPSVAGLIGTEQLISAVNRQEAISRIEATLLREDVAAQLVDFGVAPEAVLARVENMTTEELLALDGRINDQIAGGGVVGIIGVVFIVLIILELVGITDVFKSF
jgi:hypothetical protein